MDVLVNIMKATLKMEEILKVNLELWQEVTICLNKIGVNAKPFEISKKEKVPKNLKCEPTPISGLY